MASWLANAPKDTLESLHKKSFLLHNSLPISKLTLSSLEINTMETQGNIKLKLKSAVVVKSCCVFLNGIFKKYLLFCAHKCKFSHANINTIIAVETGKHRIEIEMCRSCRKLYEKLNSKWDL